MSPPIPYAMRVYQIFVGALFSASSKIGLIAQDSGSSITLTGAADVNHPQYHISGEVLTYDMNKQHFQGNGGEGKGRIRIELAPEVIPGNDLAPKEKPANGGVGAAANKAIPLDPPGTSDAQG